MHIGVDYGSKLAGTTSICFRSEGYLLFKTSGKKQDADVMISGFLEEHPTVSQVFIDAPLSLPKIYLNPNSNSEEFFYREADRAIRAMSPMFLGGLTARAMKLASTFSKVGIVFYESYPSGLVDEIKLDRSLYKKEKEYIGSITNAILDSFQLKVKHIPSSWHEVDALLAYIIGKRFNEGEVKRVGDASEGIIYY
ncbi:MAG: hypothetical protein ACO2Z9_01950 [Crocinitomicaceae bacterium]